jgi:HKD family nuclease
MGKAITGINDHLLTYLAVSAGKALSIRFNVAFLMETGAKLIVPCLEEAVNRGAEVKILTGRYMSVTEPSALYYLMDRLGDRAELRFYSDRVRSFHPKSYIFDYPDDAEIFIGSSNLSKSALTFGLEWNYSFLKSCSPGAYEQFSGAFDDLFSNSAEVIDNELLRHYTMGWRKPVFARAVFSA